MEKISGILSSSARITSVDLDESPPARPGSPNVGQKQGVVRINDRFNLSQRAKEMAAQDTMMKINPRDAAKAKIVEEQSRAFFQTRLKTDKKASEVATEVVPAAIEAAQSFYTPAAESAPAEQVTGENLSVEV